MVLTAAQRIAFFQQDTQLGIPAATYAQLAIEGIQNEHDLLDFYETNIKQVAENLRRPAGAGAVPFVFGAKSKQRLIHACDLMRYYDMTGRIPTAANLQWEPVMRNFSRQWKAIKDRKTDGEEPDVPKITRTLPIMKWTEAFPDFLRQVIGVRTIPLSYVIRAEAVVPNAVPPLEVGQPYSTEHGSVEAELIARASHEDALFRNDNNQVYHFLEEATRTTTYAASIKPFQGNRNGRGAWLALIAQYAGVDKWEAEIKKQEQLLHTRKWKGQSNFTLENFVTQHRNAFVSMTACADHVAYQLPNQHSRVGFLLNAIECSDAGLQAAMASVRTDNAANGMRNNFENAVAHIIPYDPVAKKCATTGAKRGSALISHVQGDGLDEEVTVSAMNGKPSIGKTGVHLRWYKANEFAKLSKDQKAELQEWRDTLPTSDPRCPKNKKMKKAKSNKTNKQVSALVSKEIKKLLQAESTTEEEKDDTSASISALVQAEIAKLKATGEPSIPEAPKVTLKSILKNAKNKSS